MAQVIDNFGPGGEILDVAPTREKALIQLNWTDITIKAMPATGRCAAPGALKVERTIIDNVSGAVLPGQFLAIIGASGKKTPT
jgi:ABC-type protease/lipase transport system fused ATPase/permease subunit